MAMDIFMSLVFLFAGIAVLIGIHVCVVGRAFRDGSVNGGVSIPSQAGRVPSMNAEDIKELPCFDYMLEEKGNVVVLECAVCLENLRIGEKCRVLPKCNHIFHVECIDSWLLKTGACPICRSACANSPKFEENSRFSDDLEEN